MAKRFGGFTPEQMGKIIPEMAGMQSDEQAKFLAATPGAAVRVGKMAEAAQTRIGMAEGGVVRSGYSDGGMPSDEETEPTTPSKAEVLTTDILEDPSDMTKKAVVETVSDEDKQDGMIDTTTSDVDKTVKEVETSTTKESVDIEAPEELEVATYEALPVTADITAVVDRLAAATGLPSDEALAKAQSMDPEELAQLGLSAAQIEQAQTVKAPDERVVEEGELIDGSSVDMDRVDKEVNYTAVTGSPSTDATVQGQLAGLMEDFEGSEPPAWAAGALRNASAQMAARGLSASSMAGMAMVQAAMESAIPIASADASTFAKFEAQNLSNRQASVVFAAEQRAKFLGQEFTQEFQTKVENAAKIADIANVNFTAEQQIALENARMAQSVDIANLSAANAKVLSDAAAMTNLDIANLNNRQQAAVQNAKAFLDMDVQNLANEQTTALFKTKAITDAMLSDRAEANAAKQFNTSSENQTNQFMANLATTISRHNSEQANAINMANTREENVMSQYNATNQARRDEFVSTNALVVSQANAKWSQLITTTETAEQNAANRDEVLADNEFTMAAYNATLQHERDRISYAFTASESIRERATRLTIANMQDELARDQTQAEIDMARGSGWGDVITTGFDAWIKTW